MNYSCSYEAIEPAITFIEQELSKKKIDSRTLAKTLLTAEEVLRATIEHAVSGQELLSVKVLTFPTGTELRVSAKGSPFDVSAVEEGFLFDDDAESAAVVRALVERVMGGNVSVRNRLGVNISVVRVTTSRYRSLAFTAGALILGLLVGFLMKGLFPESFNSAVTRHVFMPIDTMFLNALGFIVAPLVLFSIASSIADFGDMKALGRIAVKVIFSYFFTSLLAILLALAVYLLIPIGDPALCSVITISADSVTGKGLGISDTIKETIVGIIPGDIVSPFQNAAMLQILFIAVMLGLAASALSGKLRVFHDILHDFYAVFSRITTMIIEVMPLAVFCSMARIILTMDGKSLLSVFSWIPTIYLADILMFGVYALLILLVARLNPLTFFQKYHPTMLMAFTLSSSNACLPESMEACGKGLGISRKVYSFSLPLGATINMDGGCITQMISALFMAKIFGVPLSGPMIFSLILSIFILSVGAPGVPGGALVCLSILLPQLGIPVEALSLIMGLYCIVDMMQTCVNVTGDAAVTLITAQSEKLVDRNLYRARSTGGGSVIRKAAMNPVKKSVRIPRCRRIRPESR